MANNHQIMDQTINAVVFLVAKASKFDAIFIITKI